LPADGRAEGSSKRMVIRRDVRDQT